jgi:cell division septal protein FtsQ
VSWRAGFFGLAVVAILAAVAWALLGSRFLVVRSVTVSGTGPQVSRATVLAAAQIPAGLPLIRVDTTVVAHRVERITQVQSAQVSRDWPDAVSITIQLRTPVFAMTVPGGYALVDAFGVDVRASAGRPPGLPLLTVGGSQPGWHVGAGPSAGPAGPSRSGGPSHRSSHGSGRSPRPGKRSHPRSSASPAVSASPPAPGGPAGAGAPGVPGIAAGSLRGSPDVRAAALVLRALPPWIGRRVQAVWAASPSDVSVRLAGGIVIVWGDSGRAAEKAKEVAVLMHTHARFYDVSGSGAAVTRK